MSPILIAVARDRKRIADSSANSISVTIPAMTTEDIERNYLIVIRYDDDAEEMDVLQSIQVIKGDLERATKGKAHLVFNSDNSYLIGLVVKSTRLVAAQLRALCEHGMQNDRGFAWALELGEDFSAQGHSSGWRWLQN
jgi:hypothetical protein